MRQRLVESVSPEDTSLSPPVPPDGGWGWVVVVASLVCNIIVDGVCFSFGVFYSELRDEFDETSSPKISLIGSLLVGCYMLVGPLTSALANRFGCRKMTIAGSITASTAFVISSQTNNINLLIFLYGIIGGIGFGLIYLPAIVIVGFYFERRRALATGIAVCGSGIGTLTFPPLMEFLFERYHWQGVNLIMAGIILNCAVCGALFRPLEGPKPFKIMKPKRRIRESEIIVERGNIMQKLIDEKARQRALSTHSLDNVMITNTNSLITDPNLVNLLDYRLRPPDPKARSKLTKPNQEVLSKSMGYMNNVDVPAIKVYLAGEEAEAGLSPSETLMPFSPIGSTRSLQPQYLVNKYLQKVKDVESGVTNSGFATPPRHHRGHRLPTAAYHNADDEVSFDSNAMGPKEREAYRKDLARPLYRKDIFFAGSIARLSRAKSVTSLDTDATHGTEWTRSMVTIPDRSIYGDDDGTCSMPPAVMDVLRTMLDVSLLRSPTFVVLSLSSMLSMLGFFIPYHYIKSVAQDLGVGHFEATFLISILGLTNMIARVTVGLISDMSCVDCLLINNFALVIAGGATMLAPFCDNYAGLVIYCVVFGTCIAAFVSLRSVILVELLGLERLTNAFGLLILFQGIASISGSPIGAALYDHFQSYTHAFYTAGALIALSGIMSFPLRKMADSEFKKEKMFAKNLNYEITGRFSSYNEVMQEKALAVARYIPQCTETYTVETSKASTSQGYHSAEFDQQSVGEQDDISEVETVI